MNIGFNEEYADRVSAIYRALYRLNESQSYINFDFYKEAPKVLEEVEYKLDDFIDSFKRYIKEVGLDDSVPWSAEILDSLPR